MSSDLLTIIIYTILFVIILAELVVFVSVKLAAAQFQWILTPKSKRPNFSKKLIRSKRLKKKI